MLKTFILRILYIVCLAISPIAGAYTMDDFNNVSNDAMSKSGTLEEARNAMYSFDVGAADATAYQDYYSEVQYGCKGLGGPDLMDCLAIAEAKYNSAKQDNANTYWGLKTALDAAQNDYDSTVLLLGQIISDLRSQGLMT